MPSRLWITINARLCPLDRGDRYEDPLRAALDARAAFAEWIERVGGDTAELDGDAATLAALDAPARDRMRPFLLVRWRTRLEPLVLKDPGTGGGTGLWALAGRVCDLLPAAEQAWANAHQKRDFPYDLATAQALVDAYRSQLPGDDVDPADRHADLAHTLTMLSGRLVEIGRPDEATAASHLPDQDEPRSKAEGRRCHYDRVNGLSEFFRQTTDTPRTRRGCRGRCDGSGPPLSSGWHSTARA